MDLQEVGRGCGDWMELGSGYGQVAGACAYGDELWGCSIKYGGNFLINCKTS
jgi:hypothetical protein